MSDVAATSFQRIRQWWQDWRCRNIHADPRWPMHGQVECRVCQHKIQLKEVR